MLLAIDVGNTNIKLGIYNGGGCERLWRLSTLQRRTSDETGLQISSLFTRWDYDPKALDAAIISSVVPDVMHSLLRGIRMYFNVTPIVVNHEMKMDVRVLRGSVREVGADRLVNCVAARVGQDRPIIIVDYGTATKYDVLSTEGEFVTGITAPGIEISAEALFTRGAMLGKVDLELPPSIVAANTAESLQAGILYGRIGEAEYIINRLKKELNYQNAKVIATGGLARVVAEGTSVFDDVNPFLTLDGLKILYDTNR